MFDIVTTDTWVNNAFLAPPTEGCNSGVFPKLLSYRIKETIIEVQPWWDDGYKRISSQYGNVFSSFSSSLFSSRISLNVVFINNNESSSSAGQEGPACWSKRGWIVHVCGCQYTTRAFAGGPPFCFWSLVFRLGYFRSICLEFRSRCAILCHEYYETILSFIE